MTSSVIALGLCIPHLALAVPGVVQHGDVTYYYSANDRVYAKEINNVMYYRSSPENLYPGHINQGDCNQYYRDKNNGAYGCTNHQNAPYYTQYVDGNNEVYHWTYIHENTP
mgnify:CR=1 FL=1|tara:strand:+ start:4251 stop:4583 length:333 start_codon:yes stop_codon:yes gene_type:complete